MATAHDILTGKIAKITGILSLVSLVSGMIYTFITWHFDTFVHQEKMQAYQESVKKDLSDQHEELSTRATLNYLEIIIILKEADLRRLDEIADELAKHGKSLSSADQRRKESLEQTLIMHKARRNTLIGLPEGVPQ